MLVLDENLPAGQRLRLREWGLRFRVTGVEVAAPGTQDENLLPILLALPRPTFFSLDRDFFRPDWTHRRYCLVWLDVGNREAAEFVRRVLRHSAFDTQVKRMGTVVRVHPGGLLCWRIGQRSPQVFNWARR
jgi:hypothetical protein